MNQSNYPLDKTLRSGWPAIVPDHIGSSCDVDYRYSKFLNLQVNLFTICNLVKFK